MKLSPSPTLSSVQTDARAFFGDAARVTLATLLGVPVYAVTHVPACVVHGSQATMLDGGVLALVHAPTLESLSRAMRAAVC